MRHAKSDHPAGVADIDRPLSNRGLESAAAMGRVLSSYGSPPDLILTSPARRAAATAEQARIAGGWAAPMQVIDAFYGGGVSEVIDAAAASWSGERVLVVGHEPTWSATASALVGGGRIQMVTAAVACIEFVPPLSTGEGWLRWMLHPRLFES